MSQFYQPPDNFQYPPQASFPPTGNQAPQGGFPVPPGGGLLSGGNQSLRGVLPAIQGGLLSGGNQQPIGSFQPDSLQLPTNNLKPTGSFRPPADGVQGQRPFGVTIAAIVVAITGGLNLLLVLLGLWGLSVISSLMSFVSSSLSSSPSTGFPSGTSYPTTASPTGLLPAQFYAALGLDAWILAILFYTALGLAHLYMARGLWQLKTWAYWGVVGVEGFTILVQLIVLISSHNGAGFFASIYIPLLIAGYLLIVGEVRKTFRIPF